MKANVAQPGAAEKISVGHGGRRFDRLKAPSPPRGSPQIRLAATASLSTVADLAVVRRLMKTIGTSLLSIVAVLCCAAEEPKHNYIPKDGYVSTAGAAIKIAVAVWEPIYGAARIADEKPFHATLTKGVWTVEGSLPRGRVGGVALADISKADGRILRVSHGK